MVFKYLSMSMRWLSLVTTMTLGSMAFAVEPNPPVSLSKIFETTQYGYTLQVTSATGAAFVHDGKMYVQEGKEYTFKLTCTEADKWYIGIQPTQDDGITLDYDKRNGSQSGAGPNSTYIDITKTFNTSGTHIIAKAAYYRGTGFSHAAMTTEDIEVNIIKVESVRIKDNAGGSVIHATGDGFAYVEAVLSPDISPELPITWQYRKRDSFKAFGSWTDIRDATKGFEFEFPEPGIYEFKAELLGSSATSSEFHYIKILFGAPCLWWLGGVNAAASGYVSHSDVQLLGAETGAYTWQIADNATRVDIRNRYSGTWGDSVSGDTLPIIEIISRSPSPLGEMGVTVQVQYKGATTESYIFVYTVKATHVSDSDGIPTDPDYVDFEWISQIYYKLTDQYGVKIPSPIPQNEKFSTTDSSDWNGTFSSENWRQSEEGSTTMTYINDVIASEAKGRSNVPSCVLPDTNPPLEGQKVDHWTGAWYVGSTTKGVGLKVLIKKWQRYRGRARHEMVIQ